MTEKKNASIIIKNEVECKIEGLELVDRKRLKDKFSLFVPGRFHMPSYKLGRWDGKIEFFNIGGKTYNGLLDQILPLLLERNYEIDVIDERLYKEEIQFEQITDDVFSDCVWPAGHPAEGEPIVLRDYQVEAINYFLKNTQGIQSVSTAAGKTIVTAGLSKMVEPLGRSVVIVPSQNLVKQTHEDFVNLGLDVGLYYGGHKDEGKTHTIYTWQSISSLIRQRSAQKSAKGPDELFKGVAAVIVDEAHGAASKDLKTILAGPAKDVPIRWGLTGTIPKDDVARISLLTHIGPVINTITAKELQDAGHLSNCEINILQLKDNIVYNDYQAELNYLVTNSKRLDYLATLIQDTAKTGNILVLVDRIKTGELLIERIGEDNATFIRGSVKTNDRADHFKSIKHNGNSITIATKSLAAVGINVPELNHIMMLEPGKSFIRVIQSIGRGLRKTKNKDHVVIWDITSNAKYSKRHLTDRKKYYSESQYPFVIKKIDY